MSDHATIDNLGSLQATHAHAARADVAFRKTISISIITSAILCFNAPTTVQCVSRCWPVFG